MNNESENKVNGFSADITEQEIPDAENREITEENPAPSASADADNAVSDNGIEEILAEQLDEYERILPDIAEEAVEEAGAENTENLSAVSEEAAPAGNTAGDEVIPEAKETKQSSSSRPEGFDYRYARPEKKVKVKKERKSLPSLAIIAICLVVSLAGSFIGGYYGMQKAMKANGGTVLYQSVQRTDEDGKDITALTVESVAELVKNSVVEITTETVVKSSGFFVQEYVTEGAGSGVIISEDGYIVTNNHVIDGASTIKVRTVDGAEYTAELIGTDSRTDLAVVKVNMTGLNAAVFGSSASLKVGQSVIAVGNPLGELGGTVTDGIISALERELTIDSQKMALLQTNAAVNPGNSGGGLFNMYGELVGIVNAKSSGSGIEGLGFAIPVDDAKDVIGQLIDIGYVSGRAYMGVTLIDIQDYMTAASYRVNKYGTYILGVEEGSAADKAGLKPGDYVEAINDTEVSVSSDVIEVIGEMSVGDKVMLYIERGGEDMSIEVVLGEYVPQA